VYGLHFVLCALVCLPLGLDLVLAYLVANISNPLVAPFLITLEVEIGSLLSTGRHAAFSLERARQTGILGFAYQAGLGSIFVGAALAAIGSAIAFVVARKRSGTVTTTGDEQTESEAAMQRTIQRYRTAALGDRIYVALKLHTDPLTRLLAALPGELGRVLDAAAGRGQFGLFLWESGRVAQLFGFDSDARKVAIAERAALGDAHFETLDLLEFREREVDTLLLLDVLHYLTLPEQDELLRRAARCVPRGRIVIRELDAGRAARSAVTRGFEWIAKVSGYNRGRAGRHYRPASEIVDQLTRAGFSCEVIGASEGTPFANVLIVAAQSSGVS
jgi:2-polyprenyl-3-methyl-5-hydroxy-6-metoxy-1,4-benzoquinol methylase